MSWPGFISSIGVGSNDRPWAVLSGTPTQEEEEEEEGANCDIKSALDDSRLKELPKLRSDGNRSGPFFVVLALSGNSVFEEGKLPRRCSALGYWVIGVVAVAADGFLGGAADWFPTKALSCGDESNKVLLSDAAAAFMAAVAGQAIPTDILVFPRLAAWGIFATTLFCCPVNKARVFSLGKCIHSLRGAWRLGAAGWVREGRTVGDVFCG